jgi:hypothetical protein
MQCDLSNEERLISTVIDETMRAGDLLNEEALLEWLLDNKDRGPSSVIEEVDGAMLQSLTENFEYLVVYFCKSN